MPYTRLHYHLVWGVYGRQPVITEVGRRLLREVIVAKSVQLGAIVHAANVVADHAHLLVSLPPTLTVSALVGHSKALRRRPSIASTPRLSFGGKPNMAPLPSAAATSMI